MEVAGLAIGAVALTSLFSTCLECFDLIETGQNISRDLDIALVKLDSLRVIFLIWGNAIGLYGVETTFNEHILGPDIQRTIYRLLSNLKILFQDAERFRNRYGVEQIRSVEAPESSVNVVSLTTQNIMSLNPSQPRLGRFRNRNSWRAMFKWAIRDKKKFALLLDDVKELIQQLRDITQAAADLQSQRRALMTEVSAMSNIETLEVLEEATVEDDPELSEVASQRILQLTEGSVVSSARNQSLFTESIYYSARTYTHTHDLRSDLGTLYEPMEAITQEQFGEEAVVPSASSSEIGNRESEKVGLAFSQRNNLQMIQEQFRQDTSQALLGAFQNERIPSPHKEFLTQKLHQLGSSPDRDLWNARKWVLRALEYYHKISTPLVSIRAEDSTLRILLAAIQGPSGSAYEGGVFFIGILIPGVYPFNPPKCYFLTPIFHPNVAQDGEILLDLFSDQWTPAFTAFEMILMAIVSIVGDPDWTTSCRTDVSFIYNKDPIGFNAMSRVLTQRYAGKSELPEKLFQEHEHEILESFRAQKFFPITSEATRDWIRVNPL